MPSTYRSVVIPHAVEDVWTVVRQFDGLPAWHPVIATSTLDSGSEGQVGAVRRLTTGDGAVIVERLLALDDDAHRLTYTIVDSPFPAQRYVSTMHLAPVTESGQTFAEWSAEWDCEATDEEATSTLFGDGVFGAGLGALDGHLTGATSADD